MNPTLATSSERSPIECINRAKSPYPVTHHVVWDQRPPDQVPNTTTECGSSFKTEQSSTTKQALSDQSITSECNSSAKHNKQMKWLLQASQTYTNAQRFPTNDDEQTDFIGAPDALQSGILLSRRCSASSSANRSRLLGLACNLRCEAMKRERASWSAC